MEIRAAHIVDVTSEKKEQMLCYPLLFFVLNERPHVLVEMQNGDVTTFCLDDNYCLKFISK